MSFFRHICAGEISRPIEQLIQFDILPADTPSTNPIAMLAWEWIDEWRERIQIQQQKEEIIERTMCSVNANNLL
jgi:hypothetical protein